MIESILLSSIVISLGYLTAVAASVVILALKSGGRREERIADHEALAFSRFTIPVSVIVPLGESSREARDREASAIRTVGALLDLNYPELEVIAVADGPGFARMKAEWQLEPNEFFYRQVLATGEVRRIFRSVRDTRLLVVEKQPKGRADAMNCGVNLARYRYATVVGTDIVFDPDALMRAMAAPLAQPAQIVAASSHVECGSGSGILEALASFRALLESRVVWRRLPNGIGPHGGVVVWRRDALVQAGGFAEGDANPEVALMARLQHADLGGDASAAPAVVRTAAIFGKRENASAPFATGRSQVTAETIAALWRGVPSLELAYLLASRVLTPAVTMWAVLATITGAAAGWLSWRDVVLVLAAVSFGEALVSAAALLVRGSAADPPAEAALRRMLVIAPFEAAARAPFTAVASVRAFLAGAKALAGRGENA